jgi:hypothetical protein
VTAEEAIAATQVRWESEAPALEDVEERVAIRLRDDEREVRVHEVRSAFAGYHMRLFVRVPELDSVKWRKKGQAPLLLRGWHSGYVHELADVAERVCAARDAA